MSPEPNPEMPYGRGVGKGHTLGDVLETVAVKNGFLHTGHKSKAQVLCDFADLAQEG